jgi:hypothetical protein
MDKNKIEICTGIGLDQFTPEYVTIELQDDDFSEWDVTLLDGLEDEPYGI